MKRLVPALSLAALALALAACTGTTESRGYGGGLYVSDTSYDGYYDDYYGPIYDGYWTGDVFNYRYSPDQPFHRDEQHHVRRDAAPGYHAIHGDLHADGAARTPR